VVGDVNGEVGAYLRRLGVEPEPPSAEALARIHRAHVERVPWETLWIHEGHSWGVELATSVARLGGRRRGGYCFHLNGALSELLGALGYDVARHVGGVHGPEGPVHDAMTNHLVLTVRGLPTDANPGGEWYVDVGLGDALHDPLPLVAGTYRQGPFRFVLAETPGGVGDWHLTHDPTGGFPGMAWRSPPTGIDAFAERHTWLSTSPDSGFVRVLTVQRRDATGVDVLRGLTLVRRGEGAASSTLATKAELADVLGDLFALDVGPTDGEEFASLWRRTHEAHLAWEAAGRP
jgi:N-hydroxyarylamine O-acetyltransferase